MNIQELIEYLPQDTQEKVEEAKKQFNQIIREAIRQETRLRLLSKDENMFDENASLTLRVKINTSAGYPQILKDFFIPEEFRIAAHLSQIKHELIKLKESAGEVTQSIIALQDYDEILKFVGGSICYANDEARELLQMAEQYDLAKELLKIELNILGSYSYNTGFQRSRNDIFDSELININPEINLYWAVIGLVSGSIGVDINSLTAVVLSHELAHAYTHLGCDINGNRWNDEGFYYTESSVKEGLAQYYTERVAQKLKIKFPEIPIAYERLLEKQREEYLLHKKWIDNKRIEPETIRTALINRRTGSPIGIDEFEDLLDQTKSFSTRRKLG